jgi:hypothetical protein
MGSCSCPALRAMPEFDKGADQTVHLGGRRLHKEVL